MNHNIFTKWVAGAACLACLITVPAHSATVFEDDFDQIEIQSLSSNANEGTEWVKRFATIRGVLTTSGIGNGTLNIVTEEPRYGGAATGLSDNYDFFKQELTFSFEGFDLQPVGQGNPTNQWAKVGVSAGSGSVWTAFSHFIIAYNATGQFSVQVQQPSTSSRFPEKLQVKNFRVPYFNFDATELSKIQLVLDDTYFRILFVFGNPLDQLSFGGQHGLNRELWFFDTVGLGIAQQAVDTAQRLLDNAIASGDQAAIDSAQANYDLRVETYNAKLVEADVIKGDSSILITAASNDASRLRNVDGFTEVGASLKLDAVRVETTTTLDVLRNP